MRILLIFIIISFGLHLLMLFFLPTINVIKDKQEVIPIFVEVVKKEPQKAIVSKPNVVPKPLVTKDNLNAAKGLSKSENSADGTKSSSIYNFDELVLPNIVVPTTLTATDKSVALPDIKATATKDNPNIAKAAKVGDELKSQIDAKGISRSADSAENIVKSSDAAKSGSIYNFDVLPTNNRFVSYAPPPPDFSLENDAKVTLRFAIDKFGNTQDITFVTRNDTRVENIAYDYVRRMKFNASISDEKDFAQIVIRFSVRNK